MGQFEQERGHRPRSFHRTWPVPEALAPVNGRTTCKRTHNHPEQEKRFGAAERPASALALALASQLAHISSSVVGRHRSCMNCSWTRPRLLPESYIYLDHSLTAPRLHLNLPSRPPHGAIDTDPPDLPQGCSVVLHPSSKAPGTLSLQRKPREALRWCMGCTPYPKK